MKKKKKAKGKGGAGSFLYKPAKRLWHLQNTYQMRRKKAGKSGSGSREVLASIYGPAKAEQVYEQLQIQKYEKLLAVFLGGMGTAILLTVLYVTKDRDIAALKRPESGAGSSSYELNAEVGEERISGIAIEVPPQALTKEKSRILLQQAEEELYEYMESDGWNPDGVNRDLKLPDTLQNGMVDVRWESDRYDLVDGIGHVNNRLVKEEGEMLTLRAVLDCMDEEKILTFPIRVIPQGQDMASRLARETQRRLQEGENQDESEVFLLPDEFDGKPLNWQVATPFYGGWIALLTLAGCAAFNIAFERDLCREGEKRKEKLLFSYPSFLAKLTLLAGTGMPIRMAFAKMAKEGSREDALPVYEEVLRTCREMESGVTELEAYENFGRRCHLTQYRKCASLLGQNVRMGSSGLLAALNQEAVNAFEERKALARKKGEEAQTRLLIPMLLMLVVVMILVMVPACFSFMGI